MRDKSTTWRQPPGLSLKNETHIRMFLSYMGFFVICGYPIKKEFYTLEVTMKEYLSEASDVLATLLQNLSITKKKKKKKCGKPQVSKLQFNSVC